MTHHALEVKNLVVTYGIVPAVSNVSFCVRRGSIATIVGSNGAGKSTIMKAIAGLLKPSSGDILVNGKNIGGHRPDVRVGEGLVLVPEGRRLFKEMTVGENIELGAYRQKDRSIVARNLERALTVFPALKQRLKATAGTLSGGQQQMVAFARALMAEPKVLMLDEPTIGLAPAIVDTIADTITNIRSDGVDVLLVEQNAEMALRVSDYAFILERGEIIMHGPAEELSRSDAVRQSYLGI